MQKQLVLWSAKICPFAHRARIVARQKNLDINIQEVDLTSKTPELTKVYQQALFRDTKSDGKVPTLQHGNTILTESDLVSWYLAETFSTGNQLIPYSPIEKAKLRYFINQTAGKVVTAFYSFAQYTKAPQNLGSIEQKVKQTLQHVDDLIVGPYALGDDFSLADVMIWPWFDRWSVIQTYIKTDVSPGKYPKISKWMQALLKRQSIKETSDLNEIYVEGYKKYFQK